MVNFNTWSRVINGIRKESLIDHVYVNEPSSITNVKSLAPTFGDHLLIIVDLIFCTLKSTKNKIIRQWGGYSVNSINAKLSALLMELTEPDQFVSVQNHWNLLEFVLIKATDAHDFFNYCELAYVLRDSNGCDCSKPNIIVKGII